MNSIIAEPDWEFWSRMETVYVWECASLAVSITPSDEAWESAELHAPDSLEAAKKIRKQVIGQIETGKMVTVSKHPTDHLWDKIRLSDFSAWAREAKLDLPEKFPRPVDDKPLTTKERTTLLTIIAALADEAKIDITRPSKAAGQIKAAIDRRGSNISARTIEEHLKRAPEALERTQKST